MDLGSFGCNTRKGLPVLLVVVVDELSDPQSLMCVELAHDHGLLSVAAANLLHVGSVAYCHE